jgi:FkbM family methyltransferase
VDAPIVFYDADPDAVEGMNSSRRPTTAVAKCVGRASERVSFNITRKPHASSLLLLDPKFARAYVHKSNVEPIWGVTFGVARTIEVDTESLDSIVLSGRLGIGAPDVLTLDTEGVEFEILEGADVLLRKEIVCVVAEVAFLQIRQGQKLYGDISALLARKGFIPLCIQQHPSELSFYRAPVGLRGRGIQVFADAVFLKDPEAALKDWAPSEAAVKLRKLAVAALTFGHLEYALDCLDRARKHGLPRIPKPPQYWTFLDKLEEAAAAVEPSFMPVAFAPEARAGDSGENPASGDPNAWAGLKATVKARLSRHRQAYAVVVGVLGSLKHAQRRIGHLARSHFGRSSPVEKLLADFGFEGVSQVVRRLRIEQSQWAAKVNCQPRGETDLE